MRPTPNLRRRLAAFTYEGVLLFGLVMAVGAVYSILTNQRHGLHGRNGMMAVQFLALAVYFIGFWTNGGQTLAMKTWHVRIETLAGHGLSLRQALVRYMLAWLWFIPPALASWLAGWHQSKLLYGAMGVWLLMYAAFTRVTPGGQFLHDVIAGTRVVDTRSS